MRAVKFIEEGQWSPVWKEERGSRSPFSNLKCSSYSTRQSVSYSRYMIHKKLSRGFDSQINSSIFD